MTQLKWNDPALNAGSMIRIALWLISEVGVGGSFTKEHLRAAFKGVAQADRRMRDLRAYGWVIHTSLEDLTLNANEQRLVRIGLPVWDRAQRRTANPKSITAKQRTSALAEHDFQCSACGIAGGESYPDEPQTRAVLSLKRCSVTTGNESVVALVPECNRCRAGGGARAIDAQQLVEELNRLDVGDRAVFASWAKGGRRKNLDRLWLQFRRLPEDIKLEVARSI